MLSEYSLVLGGFIAGFAVCIFCAIIYALYLDECEMKKMNGDLYEDK